MNRGTRVTGVLFASLLAGCGGSKPGGQATLTPVEHRLKVVGIPFKSTPVAGKAPALKRSPRSVLVEVHGRRAYFMVVPRTVTPVDKAQFDEIVGVGEG